MDRDLQAAFLPDLANKVFRQRAVPLHPAAGQAPEIALALRIGIHHQQFVVVKNDGADREAGGGQLLRHW
jgi:hypothetical protein